MVSCFGCCPSSHPNGSNGKVTFPIAGASFFFVVSGFASAAFTNFAVQVNELPNESTPVPFHSLPLLNPLRRVAEVGNGDSLPAPPRWKPPAGLCAPSAGG